MKERKSNKIVLIPVMMLILAACAPLQRQSSEPTATDIPVINMPNPASTFCEQNGFTSEILTAADGSQSGICVFTDGSTCDEWAYFRGECGVETPENPKLDQTAEPPPNASGGYMQPGTSERIEDWWGVIKSADPSTQYDDYFERQDLGGAIYFGIDSLDPEVEAQIQALRDSGKIVHLYGTLLSNVPDYNGSQVQVERLVVNQ
jgi:putative hemolysin